MGVEQRDRGGWWLSGQVNGQNGFRMGNKGLDGTESRGRNNWVRRLRLL